MPPPPLHVIASPRRLSAHAARLVLALIALGAGCAHVRGAGDAFDADYVDCPTATRLPAPAAVTLTRTDAADAARVAWYPLRATQIEGLGAQRYQAQITAIAASRGQTSRVQTAPLGASSLTFDELPLTTALKVSVAVTAGSYVLSHIAAVDFVTGLAAPQFCAPFYAVPDTQAMRNVLVRGPRLEITGAAQRTGGRFYYLGFGPAFRNYAAPGTQAFFRVGLAHGASVAPADLERVNFAHYRLRLERADVGEIAGFLAATVPTPPAPPVPYDAQVLHLHTDQPLAALQDFAFATLRETTRAAGRDAAPALYDLPTLFPGSLHRAPDHAAADAEPRLAPWGLADGAEPHERQRVFAPGPHAHYDFPASLFATEGVYTLTAWAEDAAGARISPERVLTIGLVSTASRAAAPPVRFLELDLLDGWTDCGERRAPGEQAAVAVHAPTPCEATQVLSDAQQGNIGLIRDCNLLLAARAALDPEATALSTWNVDIPIAGWVGLTLDGVSERVQRLELDNLGLTGTVPPQLGALDQLTRLYLHNNQLSGPIPAALGNLSRLTRLSLFDNRLNGVIPPQLSNLSRLRYLWLGQNQLSGPIPASLGNLTQLTDLWLDDNQLRGSIPAQLGSLTQLTRLNLSLNDLDGSIPASLGNLTRLRVLRLIGNELNGSIPTQIGNLTQLTDLRFTDNQLSGSIPAQLGSLTQLTNLDLASNQLSGSIPTQLGSLTQLTSLNLSNNRLSGSIPTQLGSLTQLTSLALASNQLSGSIPTQLGSLTQLTSLDLASNQLSGSIPTQLGSLTQLTSLDLASNQLNSSIPTQLGNLTRLENLRLNNNRLSGSIPSQLGSLTQLTLLWLSSNQLSGSIPSQLSSLTQLTSLRFINNSFTGCIPSGLRNLAPGDNDLGNLGLSDCP